MQNMHALPSFGRFRPCAGGGHRSSPTTLLYSRSYFQSLSFRFRFSFPVVTQAFWGRRSWTRMEFASSVSSDRHEPPPGDTRTPSRRLPRQPGHPGAVARASMRCLFSHPLDIWSECFPPPCPWAVASTRVQMARVQAGVSGTGGGRRPGTRIQPKRRGSGDRCLSWPSWHNRQKPGQGLGRE